MTRARDLAAFVSNADGDIKFDTDTLFIDSSANRVGIGTTTPSESLHIANANDAVALLESTGSDATDDANIQLKTTNGTFTIQNDRSIGTSGALTVAGNTSNNIVVNHNDGNVGIGTTSAGNFNGLTFSGNFLSVDGPIQIKSTNDSAAVLGLGGDTYRKASISTPNGTATPHLSFAVATGGSTSSTAEVGRWLSGGGLTFNGDTAADNALDDYEEGTFTPSIGSSSGSGGAATGATGKYTKIGNMVFAQCHMSVNTLGSMSGTFFVTGFPFAAGSDYTLYQGAVRSQGIGGSNDKVVTFEMSAGTANGRFHFASGTSTQLTVAVSQLSAGDFFAIGITYNV